MLGGSFYARSPETGSMQARDRPDSSSSVFSVFAWRLLFNRMCHFQAAVFQSDISLPGGIVKSGCARHICLNENGDRALDPERFFTCR